MTVRRLIALMERQTDNHVLRKQTENIHSEPQREKLIRDSRVLVFLQRLEVVNLSLDCFPSALLLKLISSALIS